MKAYHTDVDYCAAKARRTVLNTELADLTHQLDQIHLIYVRDNIRTTATIRAELTTKRSAVRLELAMLNDATAIIKGNYGDDRRKDLLDTLVGVLKENGQEHHLQTAVDLLATA